MASKVEEFWVRMQRCANDVGKVLGPPASKYEARLVERDAELVERGFDRGLLGIVSCRNVQTVDPFQATAWLVEGEPAHLCWEYLPHMAAYVELIDDLCYPAAAVRFETPDAELRLDLAVLDASGAVLILGEVKVEPRQIISLERLVQEFVGDPGEPAPVRLGGPQGATREAWKLAHQLWVTRAPYLWLVAAGQRRAFRVAYEGSIQLTVIDSLPGAADLLRDRTPRQPVRIKL